MRICTIRVMAEEGDKIEDFAAFLVETAKAYNAIVTGDWYGKPLHAAKWTPVKKIIEEATRL